MCFCAGVLTRAACRNRLELFANLPGWVFALISVISSNGKEQLGSWGAWEVGQTHVKSKASQKLLYIEFSAERLEGQLFRGISSEWERGAGLGSSSRCAYPGYAMRMEEGMGSASSLVSSSSGPLLMLFGVQGWRNYWAVQS